LALAFSVGAPFLLISGALAKTHANMNASVSSPEFAPQSAAQVSAQAAPEPIRSYLIKDHPYYAPFINRALSNLVRQHGYSNSNHFYISKIKEYGNGQDGPWVYWKERRILMTWDRNAGTNKKGEYAPEFDLVSWWPRHVYRLDRDLVKGPYANGNDRLTERDAAAIIRDCRQTGDLFVIKAQ